MHVNVLPGNHDVDRRAVKTVAQSVQDGLLSKADQMAIAEVIGDPVERSVLLNRHDAYTKFAARYRSGKKAAGVPWWSISPTINGCKLHIAGLCSSWMSSSDQDHGHLLIGRWQVNEMLRGSADADWSIALVHHPWSFLAEFDANEVESKVHHDCHLVLRGHLHRQQARAIVYPNDRCLELAAGCCYAGSDYPNAFQLVELDSAAGSVSVHFWLWNGNEWIKDRNACPESASGIATFTLKPAPVVETSTSQDLQVIVARIQAGSRSSADLDLLREAVRSRTLVLGTGEGAVAVGGDANSAVIATGNHNTIVLIASAELLAALSQGKVVRAVPEPPADPTAYLEALRERTAHIEIRGLQVSSGNAPRFPIEELYIPLTTTLPELGGTKGKLETAAAEMAGRRSARVELDEALRQRVLVIVGDPGSGKTTFLRRIAHLLCETLLGNRADAAERELGLAGRPFPLFIRLADLAQHIAAARKHDDGPCSADAPGWIAHYLASQENEEGRTGLTEAYFRKQLKNGPAVVLFDGLDEAPSHEDRLSMAQLFDKAARAYKHCRFVLTSRPA